MEECQQGKAEATDSLAILWLCVFYDVISPPNEIDLRISEVNP